MTVRLSTIRSSHWGVVLVVCSKGVRYTFRNGGSTMLFASVDSQSTMLTTVQTIPSNDENNNFSLNTGIRRSLFGPPGPSSTAMLLEEQHKLDRDRFLENFGIDIDVEILKKEFEKPCESRMTFPRRKITNHKFLQRRTLQQYNRQTKITDFCAVKKSCRTGESKTS